MSPHLISHPRSRQNSSQLDHNQATTGPWTCSYPKGCIYHNGCNAEHILITKEDISAGAEAVVKITCSNETCEQAPYMHTACFQAFEENALAFLRGQGRAKGWSDRQKLQNLWTKRGYDLVYKACECLCGHGHIRKDLDFILPTVENSGNMNFTADNLAASEVATAAEAEDKKRKRKKTKSGSSTGRGGTTITIGLPTFTQVRVLSQTCLNLRKIKSFL